MSEHSADNIFNAATRKTSIDHITEKLYQKSSCRAHSITPNRIANSQGLFIIFFPFFPPLSHTLCFSLSSFHRDIPWMKGSAMCFCRWYKCILNGSLYCFVIVVPYRFSKWWQWFFAAVACSQLTSIWYEEMNESERPVTAN